MRSAEQPQSIPLRLWALFLIFNASIVALQLLLTPGRTEAFFFWKIAPPFNTALFGAAYLIALLGVIQATLRGSWEARRYLVPMLVVFSGVLLLATLLHSDRLFRDSRLYVWVGLYLATIVGDVLFYRAYESRGANWQVMGTPVRPAVRRLAGLLGGALILYALGSILLPGLPASVWPASLSPLMARVFAAAFGAIGVGFLWFLREPDWDRIYPVVNMSIAFVVAAVALLLIHRTDLKAGFVGTLPLLAGMSTVLAAGLVMRWRQRPSA